jgi:hypothetical protein
MLTLGRGAVRDVGRLLRRKGSRDAGHELPDWRLGPSVEPASSRIGHLFGPVTTHLGKPRFQLPHGYKK